MMLIPHVRCLQKGPLDLIETGKGLKVQTDKPHLVSLGSGRLSTAITLLPLEEGESGGATRLLHLHPYAIPALESRPVLGPSCSLLAEFASLKWERATPPLLACFPCLCLPRPLRSWVANLAP